MFVLEEAVSCCSCLLGEHCTEPVSPAHRQVLLKLQHNWLPVGKAAVWGWFCSCVQRFDAVSSSIVFNFQPWKLEYAATRPGGGGSVFLCFYTFYNFICLCSRHAQKGGGTWGGRTERQREKRQREIHTSVYLGTLLPNLPMSQLYPLHLFLRIPSPLPKIPLWATASCKSSLPTTLWLMIPIKSLLVSVHSLTNSRVKPPYMFYYCVSRMIIM